MENKVEEQEVFVVDFEAVAEGIKNLPANTHIPFIAATVDLGLMNPPENVKNAITLIRSSHLSLSPYDCMVLILQKHPSAIPQFMEQTAEYAANGVFPEGDGQHGWNVREFGQVIELLGLLTINQEAPKVNESTTEETSNDEAQPG
jgi:hypothetical protein